MSVRDNLWSAVKLNDTVQIAGIVECIEVLKMEKDGLIRIVSGEITKKGGSGVIARAEGTKPTGFWKDALK